jgi:superfamily II DNA or RNA helicase
LAEQTDGIVVTSSVGSEGYNTPNLFLVMHEGTPTSLEQWAQEMGRLRWTDPGKIAIYSIISKY